MSCAWGAWLHGGNGGLFVRLHGLKGGHVHVCLVRMSLQGAWAHGVHGRMRHVWGGLHRGR